MKLSATKNWRPLSVFAAVLCTALNQGSAQTAPASPVGMWDFTVSGRSESGLAFLTFAADGTFSGYNLLASTPKVTTTTDDDERNATGDDSRNGTSGSSSTGNNTNLFGFGPVSGPWTFDNKGRVVGFFTEVVNQAGSSWPCVSDNFSTNIAGTVYTTNLSFCFVTNTFSTNVTFTSPSGTPNNVTFTFVTNSVPGGGEFTNGVSFVGKVTPGRKFTLVCTTSVGKTTYSGVPFNNALPDISGSWIAKKRVNGLDQLNLFDLASGAVSNPFPSDFPDVGNYPNIYFTTTGQGPGYTFIGVAALSTHKKIGFTFVSDLGLLGATVGSFKQSSSATKADTKGIEDPGVPLRFTAERSNTPPPTE
jgi:hypothetical protein